MEIFYISIVSIFILSFLARKISVGKKYGLIKLNIPLFIIVTGIFIMVSGLRSNIGDTYLYKHSYNLVVMTGTTSGYEIGFIKLMEFLSKISEDSQILIFVVALICNLFIMLSFYREASYFELMTYLYITSGYYLITMNGMRQTMVAGVFFFFGIKFIKEKKWMYYVGLIFILSFFHKSIMFMGPMYLIGREKPFSKKIIALIALSGLLTMSFSSFVGEIKVISGQYGNYIDSFNEGGANILRTLVDGVPVILAYIYKDKLLKKWKYSEIFINFSTINFIFMIFALTNWIFARVTLYTALSNFILLPYIIKNCFNDSIKKIVYILCIIFYFIYYYYDQAILMGLTYMSSILGIY